MPRRNHARSAARPRRRQEYAASSWLTCPTCGKISAPDEESAWKIATAVFTLYGGEEPKRVYPCQDDPSLRSYHWTRRESWGR